MLTKKNNLCFDYAAIVRGDNLFRHEGIWWRREIHTDRDDNITEITFTKRDDGSFKEAWVDLDNGGILRGTENSFVFPREKISDELLSTLVCPKPLTKPLELELSLIERGCLPVIKSYLAKGSPIQIRLEEPWASRKLKA